MREIKLNGYIDEDIWFGDEMTPDTVREALYGEKGDLTDEVHITLNSYGGSVNAATQIHDEIRAYPGKVHITVSGTAASAAVGMAMAADELKMTPGSMMMIHDPSMVAWGNEKSMQDAIRTLKSAKESILNIYEGRVKTARDEIAQMMTDETWMDSKEALKHGFIDAIHEGGVKNSAGEPVFNREEAEKKVRAFHVRKLARMTDGANTPAPHQNARAEPEGNDNPSAAAGGSSPYAGEPEKVGARERKIRLLMMRAKK